MQCPLSIAHQEQNRAVVFARENQQAIMDKFADFQTKVCDKLVKNGVDTQQVRLFITNQFPPGDCIPPAPASLTEMFEAITHHHLWSYFHYSPLVRIAKKFGANDDEMKNWVQTYKQDLKAYTLVTTVEDCLEADLSIDANTPPVKRAKYDPCYCTPVEWKTKFMDHSLQYLAEVWELFSSHYLVPDCPPTALLDCIRKGCISVTWLVPTGLIPLLIKQVKIDTKFFQQHRILKVTVGDECIYKEVPEENISVSFFKPLLRGLGVVPNSITALICCTQANGGSLGNVKWFVFPMTACTHTGGQAYSMEGDSTHQHTTGS